MGEWLWSEWVSKERREGNHLASLAPLELDER